MKNLELKNESYIYLEQSFAEWLNIIGYSQATVNSWPTHLRELFYYLEQNNINSIQQLTAQRIYKFINQVKERKSAVTGTALSTSSVNKIINSINAFVKYINKTEKHTLDFTPKSLEIHLTPRNVLTKSEIIQLYQATHHDNPNLNSAVGQRDRAILAVFYGCGLRKDEGSRLNIMDIDFEKRLLFVRKAKGNKQRTVPIALKNLADLKEYLQNGRNQFLLQHKSAWHSVRNIKKIDTDDEAFFLNLEGKRMTSFYSRFAILKERTEIEKDFSTHTLRHSIATHLLQSGMKIEDIAKFLGHSSLDSTQIYTHLVETLNEQTHDY